jgi:hypothetical protein
VLPVTIVEIFETEAGRGLPMREKPGGVALKSSAEKVSGDIRVSVGAKRSFF